MSFSKRLLRLMSESNVTIREIANCAGVSTSTIDSWRAGTKSPSDYEAVYRVAQKLDVSFSYLLVGQDEETHERKMTLRDFIDETEDLVSGLFEVKVRRIKEPKTFKNQATPLEC
ncbi:MAG: helix-turn-helix domain-containing protein [Oligoflexales bacterium]